jgi:hypothetical protein
MEVTTIMPIIMIMDITMGIMGTIIAGIMPHNIAAQIATDPIAIIQTPM